MKENIMSLEEVSRSSYCIYGTGSWAKIILSTMQSHNFPLPEFFLDRTDDITDISGIPVYNINSLGVDSLNIPIVMGSRDFTLQIRNRLVQKFGHTITNRVYDVYPGEEFDSLSKPGEDNLALCKKDNHWLTYFESAKDCIDDHWGNLIFPILLKHEFNLNTVLELAPGGGRNTEKLSAFAKVIHCIDVNGYSLNQLQKNTDINRNSCKIICTLNDGKTLPTIGNATIDSIYCWDAAVHFDKHIVEKYIHEFSRVLKVGGKVFLHHSNYGNIAPSADIRFNPGWRSNMTKELCQEYAINNRLKVLEQKVINWKVKNLDCISILEKVAT